MTTVTTTAEPGSTADSTTKAPLLEVRNLDIHFQTSTGLARVVDGCNLTIYPNEIVGIAGESGSGKTTLVEGLMQIIRFPNRVARGQVLFHGDGEQPVDLMTLGEKRMRQFRGSQIAYVPQGSMNSLNPVLRVEDQIVDGMVAHGRRERAARASVPELLGSVGLEPKVARLYPHELSGGMKQRVIIAIAIAMEPELIIADEPTTALDVNVQRLILETLKGLRDRMGMSVLLVSHDLPVHAQLADRIGIMYAGQIVETGPIRDTVKEPLHPYTHGLMTSIPMIGGSRERIEGIGGSTPSPKAWPPGCRFHNRCPWKMEMCETTPPLLAQVTPGDREVLGEGREVGQGRQVACHLYPESTPGGAR